MQVEHHGWHSDRLDRGLGLRVYGHYGAPILVFPTSGGDEWEYERMGMVGALAHHVDSGRVKLFCVGSVNNEGWLNEGAHPRHRSWVQAMYDADANNAQIGIYTQLLHDQAVIASGAKLADPAGFATRVNALLAD